MTVAVNVAVEFRSVSKSYADVEVLSEVSLQVVAGSTTAVVGESGSGKSTLLKLINSVVMADSGEVLFFEEDVSGLDGPQHRRKFGYAVQGAGLFPHLTARENVVLLARLENWSEAEIESRFIELTQMMSLDEGLENKFPHQLSGGQCQRFGLCRAFMLKPAMLLLDEAFSAIDPITRTTIHAQFLSLREQESVTTLLVTHDMREAVKLGDDLVIIREGRILQAGAVEEVVNNPRNDYVRDLLETQL